MKLFAVRTGIITFAMVAIFALPELSRAHHLLPKNNLQCSANFPCPDELKRRIDFWVEVFRTWDKKRAILHDPDVPERVYSVINTGHGCSSKVRSKIKRERARIKNSLESVATKKQKKQKISKDFEVHLAGLFQGSSPATIRKAAKNIRCQSGVRNGFVAGLNRFHQYADMVDKVLADNNLPPEIRYLPFVESSYNPAAYSKAGAAGMWQIMPRTARVLGLELNATIDERLDPEAATQAAARYFINSTRSLNKISREIRPGIAQPAINPFIITSYNYGVNGMRRAIRKIGPDYLEVLNKYKSPSFQVAVKNFYASFIAASYLASNSTRFFQGEIKPANTSYQTVVLQHDTSIDRIKKVFRVTEKQLRPINPALTRFVWNSWRMVPAGYQLKLPKRQNNWGPERTQLASLAPETVIPGSDSYRVRKGDTACGVARALGVNCRELIKVNRLGKKATIRIGQKLIIPRKVIVQNQKSTGGRKSEIEVAVDSTPQSYRVRRGDSACKIAERYGVSCKELIRVNQLGRSAKILVGQRLTIPSTVMNTALRDGLDQDNKYIVRKGDSLCAIARKYQVNCVVLRKTNGLNKKALIFPGQKLTIPGLERQNTTETAEQLAQAGSDTKNVVTNSETVGVASEPASEEVKALENLLDTLPDLGIRVVNQSGNPVYSIRVEADETLGHYADWIGLGSSRKLRQLNNLKSNQLPIGKRLIIPIQSAGQAVTFEQKRTEYHQVLSESLKENFSLVGIESYLVKSGDSIWSMSNQLGFPVWLLYRLNPILRSVQLRPGQTIKLPKLQSRTA